MVIYRVAMYVQVRYDRRVSTLTPRVLTNCLKLAED